MKRHIVSGIFVFVSGWANGSDDPNNPASPNVLRRQGQLFTVQLVLGEPIRFFVAGREEAKLDFSDLSDLKVTVRRIKPYPGKVIKLDRQNDYFIATGSNDLSTATELEVTAKTKVNVEKIQFKIENRRR